MPESQMHDSAIIVLGCNPASGGDIAPGLQATKQKHAKMIDNRERVGVTKLTCKLKRQKPFDIQRGASLHKNVNIPPMFADLADYQKSHEGFSFLMEKSLRGFFCLPFVPDDSERRLVCYHGSRLGAWESC
jgi:hypothetical protein